MDVATLEAEGWERLPTRSFSAAIGPTFARGETGARTIALLTSAEIANDHARSVHGGALMTFADIALGSAVADVLGARTLTTVQMQYQFAGPVRPGSLLTCAPEVVSRAKRLVFVRALFEADGKVVGSADGIFRVFEALGG
ncbi:MAG: PaaI family thioesterase [Novosphingobium sp.]